MKKSLRKTFAIVGAICIVLLLFFNVLANIRAPERNMLRDNMTLLVYLAIVFYVVFFILTKLLDKRVISPIERINVQLQKVADGNPEERIHEDSSPEFVQLSGHINEMLDYMYNEWSAYSKALLARSEYSYFADLTDNIIHKPPMYKDPDMKLGRATVKYPISLDDYLENWHTKNNITPINEYFDLQSTNRDALLKRYENGERLLEYDYTLGDGHDFRRKTILLDENSEGHIIATTIISNIDEIRLREIEMNESVRAALKAAEEASSAKTNFLSRMSHDIRTPMNGIIGMTKIAQENIDDPARVKDCLDKITLSSSHLLTLINDILELSRIESGKLFLANEVTNLQDISKTCISVLESSTAGRNIETSVTFDDDDDNLYVYTDAIRMRQVILNIISNAVKYTPDGGRIDLIFRKENLDDTHVKEIVTVSDTGIGMSEEYIKHIFEPFSQEDESGARTKYAGTGLGMAIVKELMDMFGGTVEIDSAEGKGTTVTLTFPLQQAEKMESIEEELIEDEDVSLDGVKVLLVEDNELNREIAAEMLKEFGCEVVEAVDGQEAVDKYTVSEIGEFDIVFMDIMMPNLNGYEATNEIRSSVRSDAKTIPIVALSANAFAEDVEKSREAGMNEHLSKPIEPDRLLAVIKHMVHKQK